MFVFGIGLTLGLGLALLFIILINFGKTLFSLLVRILSKSNRGASINSYIRDSQIIRFIRQYSVSFAVLLSIPFFFFTSSTSSLEPPEGFKIAIWTIWSLILFDLLLNKGKIQFFLGRQFSWISEIFVVISSVIVYLFINLGAFLYLNRYIDAFIGKQPYFSPIEISAVTGTIGAFILGSGFITGRKDNIPRKLLLVGTLLLTATVLFISSYFALYFIGDGNKATNTEEIVRFVSISIFLIGSFSLSVGLSQLLIMVRDLGKTESLITRGLRDKPKILFDANGDEVSRHED
jgi:hypothetical protein